MKHLILTIDGEKSKYEWPEGSFMSARHEKEEIAVHLSRPGRFGREIECLAFSAYIDEE